jgi:hypothetical protein
MQMMPACDARCRDCACVRRYKEPNINYIDGGGYPGLEGKAMVIWPFATAGRAGWMPKSWMEGMKRNGAGNAKTLRNSFGTQELTKMNR